MGDINRISKQFADVWFLKTCQDSDMGKLSKHLSPFYTRPVYQYTKAECGGREKELRRNG